MSKNNKFRGTGVAIVTPFYKDNAIDFKSFGKLVDHIINGGVEYIVVLGTTGESVTLTKEEKKSVVAHVIETIDNRVPLVLGLGGNNTQEILNSLSHSTDFNHISAILSVSPYYNKPNQRGIYQHYKAISEACPVPVILYNVPGRTNSNITADTTLKLANDFKNIIGIKEASGNLEQCMKIIKNKPKDFLVISGDDLLTLPMIACGADGVISVVANAFPKDFSEMTRQILAGNVKDAQKIHYKLADIIEQLFADGNPAGIKAALELLNIAPANLRLPLVKVNKATQNALAELIDTYK
ncbi:MAG: 4-hydroxy-tetrahydrodipicolinate synthase [Bacteroidetes bacterium RIFCSPLOWO2_12_FULL_35_15]|nr:MAG: 4-hydroxy-tetrahydrodipicolinate synthase [Bacteroidetes bacterium RIFCSPLOWO2_12_FULL_35_15]